MASSDPEAPTGPADTTSTRGSAPLWMRVLLVASLAINLLMLGIAGGAMLSRADRSGPPRDMATALYMRALPDRHREVFEDRMRGELRDRRVGREALRGELAATLAELRAENFDAAAFAQRIARQRGRLAERTALGDSLLVERLAAMSLEERRAYADRLQETLVRLRRGRD